MNITLDEYYDRFNGADNYTRHLFLAGNILQSAELNELQSFVFYQAKINNDSFLNNGDLLGGGGVFINATPAAVCQQSTVYIDGSCRVVPAATVPISLVTTDKLGVWHTQSIITPADNVDLLDPALGQEGYGEDGASRLREVFIWGLASVVVADSVFYPVFDLINGVLSIKNNNTIGHIDAPMQILEGLQVTSLGGQSYAVSDGVAIVCGKRRAFTAKNFNFVTSPSLLSVSNEVYVSTTVLSQRVELKKTPISSISSVEVTKEKTETITRGGGIGGTDTLPDADVVAVVSVVQGVTTFEDGVDFVVIDDNKISWSLGGSEPAGASEYDVTYQYRTTVSPTSPDYTGFTVTGAIVGTDIVVSYIVMLPRIDLVSLAVDGTVSFHEGVSSKTSPSLPNWPINAIALAYIYQSWDKVSIEYLDNRVIAEAATSSNKSVLNDDLLAMALKTPDKRIDWFFDNFVDESKRNSSIPQDAAVFDGTLTLPIDSVEVLTPSSDILSPLACAYNNVSELSLELKNSSFKINQNAINGLKHKPRLTLGNQSLRWPVFGSGSDSFITGVFNLLDGGVFGVKNAPYLKLATPVSVSPIDVVFVINGFAVGETLDAVSVDGVSIPVSGL